jgi:oxygen-dependent protoporphyrinogen oxidase
MDCGARRVVPKTRAGGSMSTIAVVGGGIAGLTAAFTLSAAHDVTLFESEATAGGKIRSQQLDGFLFEWGPSGFLSNAQELNALAAELELTEAVIDARPEAKNRFIFWDGKLHKLPSKPPEIFSMSLLSPMGKLRAFRELFVPRRAAGDGDDESVYAFMARRFGTEVAERIGTPALLGVSGGDAANTSLAAIFPRLRELERERGSVIRGMVRGSRTASQMRSFAGSGMQRLTDRLAERLGDRVQFGTTVTRIEPDGAGWRIGHDRGEMAAERVVIATPANAAAGIVAGFDAELARQLGEITYAPMRVIGVGFRRADVAAPLDGFGFLAARGCGVRILGATYTSSMLPEQAPPGTVYVRIFMGGAADPTAAQLSPEAARSSALADLATTLGITAAPIAYHETVWHNAIPQYALGHRKRVQTIEQLTSAHQGLALIGNSYRGLGVNDTIRDARSVAARVGTTVR